MEEIAIVLCVLGIIAWLFWPNTGNDHLSKREQKIEYLAHDIMHRNKNISYSEAYQEAVDKLNKKNKYGN